MSIIVGELEHNYSKKKHNQCEGVCTHACVCVCAHVVWACVGVCVHKQALSYECVHISVYYVCPYNDHPSLYFHSWNSWPYDIVFPVFMILLW